MSDWKNKLYFGDNLQILRDHVADESVDLIYLDPPFNSKVSYNVLYKAKNGSQSASQITAFDDTWHWGKESEVSYHEVITVGLPKVANLLQALRSFLGTNDMMAYLTMMAIRLTELHRVLKPTGSIYLHCDPTASHYLKLVMDAIFSPMNFRNEIIWKRTAAHSDSATLGNVHDILLYHSKSETFVYNPQFIPYSEDYIDRYYRHKDERGRFLDRDLTAGGLSGGGYTYDWQGITKVWRCPKETMQQWHDGGLLYYTSKGTPRKKQYLKDMPGRPLQDTWTDVPPLNSQAQERLGYPTQKPEALLERIIQTSSNEGDTILDPFCGCGTAIAVAEEMDRRWIGIDVAYMAIPLIKRRLRKSFGKELSPFTVEGIPKTLQDARALAESGPEGRYQFQWWAIDRVDAHAVNDRRKGADRGVDGIISFFDDDSGIAKKILIQVKSGHVNRGVIATLRGDMETQKATLGVLISLEPPTKSMKTEALSAGFYTPSVFPSRNIQKIQILTAKELFEEKRIDYYKLDSATFRDARSKPLKKGSIRAAPRLGKDVP